ncbi:replication-relaxation family protein [Streptomyces sp. NPDC058954]|uniref:replication-relaxation family protein n=1 Tax=Streptomyces sp. NPDC058954 TaxID=3346677 RepID=UPI00368F5C9C
MLDVDTGGLDRVALAVLAQYRMATTEQMHLIVAPGVRIEQTRRRLAKLREEGLVDRITLPRAGRTRVWFATQYGVDVVSEWPELREWRPPRLTSDRTAARLRVGHALVVTETGLAFLQDARRRGDVCRPLDWIPEVYHPLGSGEAVIPDALLYYRTSGDGDGGSMLRAFVEVDRATMGPERLAAKLTTYSRLHDYVPTPVGRPRPRVTESQPEESWKRRYARFPRLLFVLDGTGPIGTETRIRALHASTTEVTGLHSLLSAVPILAAPLVDILRNGPSAPVWRPIQAPEQSVSWMGHHRPPAAPTRPTDPEPDPSWPVTTWGPVDS